MADQQLNSFNITIQFIDETGNKTAEELVDLVLEKVQEIPSIKLQMASANINIQVPDQQVNRFFNQVVTEEENGKKVLKIKKPPTLDDLPKDDKPKNE